MMMIGSIFSDNRSQCASTQTIDMLNGKKTIGGNLAWFNPELAGSLVKKKVGAPDMTGPVPIHMVRTFLPQGFNRNAF
jgi:hypothetical protein